MKTVVVALLLAAWPLLAPSLRAGGTIDDKDYPVQYEVVDNGANGKLVSKGCSMTLRDRAKTGVIVNVARKGFGSCHPLDVGKVYRGRENTKKNEIELVVPVGDDRARVENWEIIGTVNSPRPAP